MNKKPLLKIILLFLLFILISAGFIFFGRNNSNSSQNAPGTRNSKTTSNPQLEQEYEQEVKRILKPFFQDKQTAGLKDQILSLRAPAKYLELHLKLVLSFDKIYQGQKENDQSIIESGFQNLDQLKNKYPWLD